MSINYYNFILVSSILHLICEVANDNCYQRSIRYNLSTSLTKAKVVCITNKHLHTKNNQDKESSNSLSYKQISMQDKIFNAKPKLTDTNKLNWYLSFGENRRNIRVIFNQHLNSSRSGNNNMRSLH